MMIDRQGQCCVLTLLFRFRLLDPHLRGRSVDSYCVDEVLERPVVEWSRCRESRFDSLLL